MAKNKTNAMRMLNSAQVNTKFVDYSFLRYQKNIYLVRVAELIQANVKTVFKTLVLENKKT